MNSKTGPLRFLFWCQKLHFYIYICYFPTFNKDQNLTFFRKFLSWWPRGTLRPTFSDSGRQERHFISNLGSFSGGQNFTHFHRHSRIFDLEWPLVTHTPSNRKHYFSTTHVRDRGVVIFWKLEIRNRSLIWPAHFFRFRPSLPVMTSGTFQTRFWRWRWARGA